METVLRSAGPGDDEFLVYACGKSSGHVSGWTTYKRSGLALYSVSYTPERQDGYKNGIVRDIGIFDTANLAVKSSKQQEIYYGESYYPVSRSSLELVFGKPDKIKNVDTVQYILYSKRQMTFVFNKETKQFIRLYISNKK